MILRTNDDDGGDDGDDGDDTTNTDGYLQCARHSREYFIGISYFKPFQQPYEVGNIII